MFKDYTFPDWANLIGVVSFIVALAIFIGIIVRALTMSRREAKRMSELPLSDQPTGEFNHDEHERRGDQEE